MATTDFMKAKNRAATTLDGNITDADLSILVVSSAVFPTTYPFPISIDDELLSVTNNNTGTNTLTVTRAQESTSAVAHTDGTTVEITWTAKYITDLNTAVNALETNPVAHKDRHDPADGGDPLDTAAAAEIVGVQAAGTGTSHSLARADHAHQIQHSIANNHLVTIDGTTNTPANLDYAKFTASGLEGKAYSEVKTDLGAGAASGLASLNASTKVVEQPASVSDHLDDTAGGTDAEVTKAPTSNVVYDHGVATTGVHGGGIGDADGDTKIQCEESADEDKIRMDVKGVESLLLSDIGELTLAKQSRIRGYRNGRQSIPNAAHTRVFINVENFDNQNEFNISAKGGTADATEANKLHDADGGFAASDVGCKVWNTTDDTYTYVTAYVDSGELTLNDDIFISGEGYSVYNSIFTAKEAGTYLLAGAVKYYSAVADKLYYATFKKNGVLLGEASVHSSYVANLTIFLCDMVTLAVNDYVELGAYHTAGATVEIGQSSNHTFISIHKLS